MSGHTYRFGAPSGGWPTFGPDGKRVRDSKPEKNEPKEKKNARRSRRP